MPRFETSTLSLSGSHSATPAVSWIDSSITLRPGNCWSRFRMRAARSRAVDQFLAVEGQMPPPAVDGPVHQRRRTRRGYQIQPQPQIDGIDEVAADEDHRGLAQPSVGFVQTLDGEVRARLH